MVYIEETPYIEIPTSVRIDLDKRVEKYYRNLFRKKSVPEQKKIDSFTALMKIKGNYIATESKPNEGPTEKQKNLLKALSKNAIDVSSIDREPLPLLERTKFTVGELDYKYSMKLHHAYKIYNKNGKIMLNYSGPDKKLFDMVVDMIIPIGSKFNIEEIKKEAREKIKAEGLWLEDPYKKIEELKSDKTPVNIKLEQSLMIWNSKKKFYVNMRLIPRLSYPDNFLIKDKFNHLNILTGAYVNYIMDIPNQKERIEAFNRAYEIIPVIAASKKFESIESAKKYIDKYL